jgi:Zn-dependent protease with chaperone function
MSSNLWARSYSLRAVLAIALLVGFYATALGLALGLLAIPYLMYTEGKRVYIKVALLCVVGAGAILWSILPRIRRWEEPGPRLTEEEQPRLFAIIRDVARRMEMPMPAEVYLIADVNAFVTQRGGFLGLGSRKVMGIGLGLLAVDNVSQLRATLAHEFGHFKGGETRLSGLIYGTRTAMIRTLESLHATGSSMLHLPFEWMLKAYLRITQAISRQQELVADEWSVRLEGKTAHLTGLDTEALHGTGFSLYLRNEVNPLCNLGVAPANLFEGYRRFLGSSGWKKLEPKLAEYVSQAEADPYDSHPGHEERKAFAQQLALPDKPMDTTPALSLLEKVDGLEARISEAMRPEELKPVSWNEAAARWGELWAQGAARMQQHRPQATFGEVVRLLRDTAQHEALAEAVEPRLVGYREEDRAALVRSEVVGHASAYLASILARHGFQWQTEPGEPLMITREGHGVDVRALVSGVVEGEEPPETLLALAREAGVPEEARWPVAAAA